MFQYCSELVLLNLENFKTSNIIDMSNIFCGFEKLQSLNLIYLQTQKVITMENMFHN